MDFRREKLRLSLGILAVGMLLGLGWAAWQGWGLGRTYPYNTILCYPKISYSDFTVHFLFSSLPSPYDDIYAIYLPGAYVFFRLLQSAGLAAALVGFVAIVYFAGTALQDFLLRPVVRKPILGGFVAVLLTLLSYPLLLCLDRGNIEVMMVVLIGAALALLERRYFAWAAFLICITVVMKLYPAVLLLLFLRKRHLDQIGWSILACGVVTVLCVFSFAHSLLENLALWRGNYAFYDHRYLIENDGLAGSASPWNLAKVVFLTVCGLGLGMKQAAVAAQIPLLLAGYKVVYLGLLAGAVFFVTFIEREFFRRALLLLLVVTTSAPNGGDYKLGFVHAALLLLILISTRRPHDFLATGLLALILIPKKELFLTYLGNTDTGFPDVNIGVLLNPLCLIAVTALLVHDGWRRRIPGWGARRFEGLVSPLRKWTPAAFRKVA